MKTKQKEPADIAMDEKVKPIDRNDVELMHEARISGNLLITMGIAEIIFGVLAMTFAAFASTVFVILLGAAIVVSGTLGVITSIAHNNLGRFLAGIISLIAGIIVIAHPVFGLNFLTLALGVYLVAVGIARLFDKEKRTWARVAGAIGIVLGIIVLIYYATLSAWLIGLIVGINIVLGGIISTGVGRDIKKALQA